MLIAQQSAVSRQYSVAFEQSELLAASPPVIGFTTLQRAQAVEITDRGIGAPTSRSSRALLGGLVGFALGVGIALLLGQLDRRIRTKEQAEELLDMRSRVVIPKVRDKDRDQLVVTSTRHDPLSDSYRTVRNIVDVHAVARPRPERAPVTLVVSPGPGDGKTSLSANLAAAIAESGKRTILVNSDFRRPRLSKLFGPEGEEPLPVPPRRPRTLSTPSLAHQHAEQPAQVLDLSPSTGRRASSCRASITKLDELTELSDCGRRSTRRPSARPPRCSSSSRTPTRSSSSHGRPHQGGRREAHDRRATRPLDRADHPRPRRAEGRPGEVLRVRRSPPAELRAARRWRRRSEYRPTTRTQSPSSNPSNELAARRDRDRRGRARLSAGPLRGR